MKYLVRGMESKRKIMLLLSITKIEREDLVAALIDHFVNDFSQTDAAIINGVKQPNMIPAIESLNDAAKFGEKYHEFKIYEQTSIKNEK